MYDKLGKIGEGTHGSVFKAKNRVTKEVVAIKPFYIDQQIGVPTSALREMCVLKQLSHPNVTKLLDLVYNNASNKSTSNTQPLTITLVYEYCNQDLKHYCDSIASCGKQVEQSTVRFVCEEIGAQNMLFDLCSTKIYHRLLKYVNH